MITAFWILAGITFLQSLISLRNGVAWLKYVRGYRPAGEDFLPPVTLIIPCRGSESGLAANLAAYREQDYPDYEVIFVTGGPGDTATAAAEAAVATSRRARLIFAPAANSEGDKVAKLRWAVSQARETSRVLAFADSDGRPCRRWLRHLVAPLADPAVGATTGYRWYLSGQGMASVVRSVWNSFIASLLGDHAGNFCWGGSTAVRREAFSAARVEEFWKGSVSDDSQLTNALKRAGLRIVFVPRCLVPSSQGCGWGELFAWTTRQIIITRVYAPRLWVLGLVSHGVYSFTLGLGLALTTVWPPAAMVLALALLPGALKGLLRVLGAESMLPAHAGELARLRPVYALLAALIPLLMLYNFVVAGFTRRIEWRGVWYELAGTNRTKVLRAES